MCSPLPAVDLALGVRIWTFQKSVWSAWMMPGHHTRPKIPIRDLAKGTESLDVNLKVQAPKEAICHVRVRRFFRTPSSAIRPEGMSWPRRLVVDLPELAAKVDPPKRQ